MIEKPNYPQRIILPITQTVADFLYSWARELVDYLGEVFQLVNRPETKTNAEAESGEIFFSSDSSVLSYKDAGGTVHGLY